MGGSARGFTGTSKVLVAAGSEAGCPLHAGSCRAGAVCTMNVVLNAAAAGFCECVLAAWAAQTAIVYNVPSRFLSPMPLAALAAAIGLVAFCGSGGFEDAAVRSVALSCCAVAAITDAQTGYVFDSVTIPSLAALLCIAALTGTLGVALGGAACAGGALTFLWVITRGRGIGGGDVKLACCIGAAAGVTGALTALFLAFVAGGAYAAFLLFTRRAERGAEMRFAPYLAASLAVVFLMQALT